MIVSVTERGSYKRCRRQWLINSRNRWSMTKIVAPNALALGTLIHDTLGLWLEMYKAGERLPDGGLANLFLQYANNAINTARATYEQQVGTRMSDGELTPLYESVVQGQAMMLNYQERWKQPIPHGFEVVATETRCTAPIPGSEHTEEWVWEYAAPLEVYAEQGVPESLVPGLGWIVHKKYPDVRLHYLEGRLDGILRELRTGKLYTLEHKSYGQRPREDVLFAQDQFLAYHWMLLALADQMQLDAKHVAGVAYDGLWKRAAPPKIVDGHKGSLADLFCRRLITRPVQELVEFEAELLAEVLEMANNPPIYKNRTADGSCFWGCSDNQLCLAMSRGEDTDYMLKSQYKRKTGDELVTHEESTS